MAGITKDSQPSAVAGQTPSSFPSATPPPLGAVDPPPSSLMEEWNLYWRGSLILSLLFGALLIGGIPSKTLFAGVFILMINLIFYPFFLLARNLWRNSLIGFILYVIVLSATPLLMSLWVLVSLLLSKCLVVRKFFWIELVVALALFLGLWSYAVRHPNSEMNSPQAQELQASSKEEKAIGLSQEQVKRIEAESQSVKFTEAKPAPTSSSIGQAQSVEFRDPNGYFRANLPVGFKVTDKTQGTRSKVILTYSPDFEVVVIASETANATWDPQIELNKKREAIESGAAGPLSRMKIDSSELVVVGGFKGYELKLSSDTINARAYAMVGSGVSVSISMVMKTPGAAILADLFKQALQQTLTPRPPPPPPEEVKAVANP